MKSLKLLLCIFFIAISTLSYTSKAEAISAVATLKRYSGDVKIQRSSRIMSGRRGLVLKDADVVITALKSKATILFRDGSEIRLFQNTKFVIEKSEESAGSRRGFFNRFKLKVGSFWGKFAKGRQQTIITTPSATCGIKGTNVSFQQRDGKLNVSLSAGEIELENEDEKMLLSPGKIVSGIQKTGSFKNNVKELPFRLVIAPDHKKIKIPTEGHTDQIHFTIQLIDVNSKRNVNKSASIYVSLASDRIIFPERIYLNKRGYRRISAQILPFKKSDYKTGQIEVLAIAEGEKYLNVSSGRTVLTYDIPDSNKRIIRINASSGKIQ